MVVRLQRLERALPKIRRCHGPSPAALIASRKRGRRWASVPANYGHGWHCARWGREKAISPICHSHRRPSSIPDTVIPASGRCLVRRLSKLQSRCSGATCRRIRRYQWDCSRSTSLVRSKTKDKGIFYFIAVYNKALQRITTHKIIVGTESLFATIYSLRIERSNPL